MAASSTTRGLDEQSLAATLSSGLPSELARDLAHEFLEIRIDVATETLGRSAPGKFVETVVQCLQSLERGGAYDQKPDVDRYLRELESRASGLSDDLRICVARLSRSMYAIRSKRSIAHKNQSAAQLYDLRLLYVAAQWVVTELILAISPAGTPPPDRLLEYIQMPVGGLVETLGDRRLVHGEMRVDEEVLVLLMSYFPAPCARAELIESMDRRNPRSVTNSLRKLWLRRLIHYPAPSEVVLTQAGMKLAIATAQEFVD